MSTYRMGNIMVITARRAGKRYIAAALSIAWALGTWAR